MVTAAQRRHELEAELDETAQNDRFLRSARGVSLTLASGASLAALAMLDPDPRGYGTHEQLGFLDSCPAARSGECPSCGLLTSVVHGVRGNVVESMKTHGAGLPIVLALAWAFVAGVTELLPRPWPSARARRIVTATLAVAIGIGVIITAVGRTLGDV